MLAALFSATPRLLTGASVLSRIVEPALKLQFVGGQSLVGWGWEGQSAFLDMIEIHVNRGSGYVLLAMDTTPDYLDTFAAPAGGAKWTYKAIYRLGDQARRAVER